MWIREKKSTRTEVVFWDIGVDGPISPEEPLPEVPAIPKGALLVITGRGPVWRYGMALLKAQGSPAGAVAMFDPGEVAFWDIENPVVVVTHSEKWDLGQVIA